MRKERRQVVSRPAHIDLGDGRLLTCRIADVSRGGALLHIQDSEWLPKTFELIDTFTGARRAATVAWTASNRAGVRFIDYAPAETHKGFGRRK